MTKKRRTTIIWIHGMGDSAPGFSVELQKTLVKPFASMPKVSGIVHEEITYEDINELANEKILKADFAISDVCNLVTVPVIGSLSPYRASVKDALGDVFPDWLSRGIRMWIFHRINKRILEIVQQARDDGVTPRNHNINIICHSLGTFITYEFLHWAKDVFQIGVSDFKANNVFMLAPVIAVMKELRLGAAMSNFDLAINSPLSKPWVHNPATGVTATNVRKLWAYRHKWDPFASLVPLKGELLDHPAWTFDAFHAGGNMHAYDNYLTEFSANIMNKVLESAT